MLMTLLLAGLVGITLGVLGGGGSILAVPILTYVADLPAKEAIATSLVVVGVTAAFALIPHARGGHVEWRTGAVFAVTSMIGSYGGGLAAGWFSGGALLLLFAGMMVVTALAMIRDAGPRGANRTGALPVKLVIVEGALIGALTGLVGAGGGFLVVPALVILGGMEMRKAIGTSLLVIAAKSFSGVAGHLAHVSLDLELAGTFAGTAVAGSVAGAFMAQRLPQDMLRRGFAWFVLTMAAVMAWREAGVALAVGLLVLSASVLLYWRSRGERPDPREPSEPAPASAPRGAVANVTALQPTPATVRAPKRPSGTVQIGGGSGVVALSAARRPRRCSGPT